MPGRRRQSSYTLLVSGAPLVTAGIHASPMPVLLKDVTRRPLGGSGAAAAEVAKVAAE